MAKAVPAHQGSLEQWLSKAKPLYHLAASLCSITGWGHAENLTSVQKLRHIPRESNAGDCQVLHSSCLGGRPFGREIWAAHLSIYTDTQKNSRARKTRVEKAEIILLIITYLSWITAVWIQEKGYKNNLFFPFFKAICNPAYCSRNLSLRRSSQINLRISSGCLTWTLITFCWLPWGNLPFVWVFFNCRFRSQRKCVKLYLRGAAMPLLPIDSITVQTLPHRKYYWWCQVVQDQGFWSLGRGSDNLICRNRRHWNQPFTIIHITIAAVVNTAYILSLCHQCHQDSMSHGGCRMTAFWGFASFFIAAPCSQAEDDRTDW